MVNITVNATDSLWLALGHARHIFWIKAFLYKHIIVVEHLFGCPEDFERDSRTRVLTR